MWCRLILKVSIFPHSTGYEARNRVVTGWVLIHCNDCWICSNCGSIMKFSVVLLFTSKSSKIEMEKSIGLELNVLYFEIIKQDMHHVTYRYQWPNSVLEGTVGFLHWKWIWNSKLIINFLVINMSLENKEIQAGCFTPLFDSFLTIDHISGVENKWLILYYQCTRVDSWMILRAISNLVCMPGW